ncbi:hypothetical protein ACQPZP_14545 [Spirillospora sp. CA-142024]|uniref:hypothetical protein n=1 Tax=Spirillospora sp. CA-142024 TaxID=3240036 RepID=UPI003D9401F3
MTEGQHSHDELRSEIDALKTQLEQNAQQGDAVTQEATTAAVNAQQAAEVAVTEAAVTRADLESLRDELKAAIAEVRTAPAPGASTDTDTPAEGPQDVGTPAAPADLPDPPAGEVLDEGAPQEAPAVEEKDTKNRPPRKRKSAWWG